MFVIPGCAEGADPESIMRESGWWLWIPGSREDARPGMTVCLNTLDVVPAKAGTHNHRTSW